MTASNRHIDLEAYVDGELDVAARAAVDIHVAGCAACRGELAALEVLQRRLASHPVPDPGDRYWASFASRVEARLRSDAEPARGWERLTGWLFPQGHFAWPRAAGALAMCTLLVYVGLRGFDPAHLRIEPRATRGGRANAPASPPASAPVPAPAPAPPAAAPQSSQAPAPSVQAPQLSPVPAPTASAPQSSQAPAPSVHASQPSPAPAPRSEPSQLGTGAAKPVPEAKSEAGNVAPPPAPAASSLAPEKDARDLAAESRADATGPAGAASKPDADSKDQSERLQASPARPVPAAPEARSRTASEPLAKSYIAPTDDAKKRKGTASDALESSAQSAADPVVGFVAAASTGDVVAARVAAAATGIDVETQQTMQRWLQLATVPPLAAPHTNGFATPPPTATLSKPSSKERAKSGAGVESLLLLDALAAPRRADPALRAAVVRITTGLLPHADDPRVVPRVRASLEWLAATSESATEQQHWRTELDRWPAH